MLLKPFVCELFKTADTFGREPERVVSPVICKASSIVTSSVDSTAFIKGVWTSGDVICVDTDISLQPRTPVNYGSFLFAFNSNAYCKVYEVPSASKFISCGAASNRTLPLTWM